MNKTTIPVIVALAGAAVPVQVNAQTASYTKLQLQVARNEAQTQLLGCAKKVQEQYLPDLNAIDLALAQLADENPDQDACATIDGNIKQLKQNLTDAQKPYTEHKEAAEAAIDKVNAQYDITKEDIDLIVVDYVKEEAQEKVKAADEAYLKVLNDNIEKISESIEAADAITDAAGTYVSTLSGISSTYKQMDADTQSKNEENYTALNGLLGTIKASIEQQKTTVSSYYGDMSAFIGTEAENEGSLIKAGRECETWQSDLDKDNEEYNLAKDEYYSKWNLSLTGLKSKCSAYIREALAAAKEAATNYTEAQQAALKLCIAAGKNLPFDPVDGDDQNIKDAKTAINNAYSQAMADATDATAANYTADKHNEMEAKICMTGNTEVSAPATEMTDGTIITLRCMDKNGGDGYYFNGAEVKSSTLNNANFFKIVSNGEGAFYLQRVSDGKFVANNSDAVAMVDDKASAAPFKFSIESATGWTTVTEENLAKNGINTVRFTTSGTFLNCQNTDGTPKYYTGTGGYSIWDVHTYAEASLGKGTDVDAIKEAQSAEVAAQNNYNTYQAGITYAGTLTAQLNTTKEGVNTLTDDKVKETYLAKLETVEGIITSFSNKNEENYKAKSYTKAAAEDETYQACLDLLKDGDNTVDEAYIQSIGEEASSVLGNVNEQQKALDAYTTAEGATSISKITVTSKAGQDYTEQINAIKAELNSLASGVQDKINTYKTESTAENLQTIIDGLKSLGTSYSGSVDQLNAYAGAFDAFIGYKQSATELYNKILPEASVDPSYPSKEDITDDRTDAADLKEEIEEWEGKIKNSFTANPRICTTVKDELEREDYSTRITTLSERYSDDAEAYTNWMAGKGDNEAYKSLMNTYTTDQPKVEAQLARIVTAIPTHKETIDEKEVDVPDTNNDGGWVVSPLDWDNEKAAVNKELEDIKALLDKHGDGHQDCYKNLTAWTQKLNDAVTHAGDLVNKVSTLESDNIKYQDAVNAVKDYDHYTSEVSGAIDAALADIKVYYNNKSFEGYDNASVVSGLKDQCAQKTLLADLAKVYNTEGECTYKTVAEAVCDATLGTPQYAQTVLNTCKNSAEGYIKDFGSVKHGSYDTENAKITALEGSLNGLKEKEGKNLAEYNALAEANTAVQDAWTDYYNQVVVVYKDQEGLSKANDLYVGQMNDKLNDLIEEAAAIKASWNAGTAETYNVVEGKNQIKIKESAVKEIAEASKTNLTKYQNQIARIDALTAEADPEIDGSKDGAYTAADKDLKDLYDNATDEGIKKAVTDAQDKLAVVKAEIDALPATAMEKCNIGKSAEYDEAFNATIDAKETGILARIDEIVSTAHSNFNSEVANYNNAIHQEFAAKYKEATDYLSKASATIAKYNSYSYNKGDNPTGYTEAINVANEALFPYSNLLTTENTAEGTDYTTKKDDYGYFDRDKSHWNQMNTYLSEMVTAYNNFLAATEPVAENYFSETESNATSDVADYQASTESYTYKEDADKEFETVIADWNELTEAIAASKEAKDLAQKLEGTEGYIAKTNKSVANFKTAANEAAKVEVDAFIKKYSDMIAEYKANDSITYKDKVYHYQGEEEGDIKYDYLQAISEQEAIVEDAKKDESDAYGTTSLKDAVADIEDRFSSMEANLKEIKEECDSRLTKNVSSEIVNTFWEPVEASRKAQADRIDKTSETYAFGDYSDEVMADGGLQSYLATAKTKLNRASSRITRYTSYGETYCTTDYKNIVESYISDAQTAIDKALERAEVVKQELYVETEVGQVDAVKTAAQGLISPYYRAKANDTESKHTSELDGIYASISNIITTCNAAVKDGEIIDQSKVDEMVQAYNDRENAEVVGSIANLKSRIEAADDEIQSYNTLSAAVETLENTFAEAQQKVEDVRYEEDEETETELYRRLINDPYSDQAALDDLSDEIGELKGYLASDHDKNLCGKSDAVVNGESISKLQTKAEELSSKISGDIDEIKAQIAKEEQDAQDRVIRQNNEGVYDIACMVLNDLYTPADEEAETPTTESGYIVNVQESINEDCKDVCGDYTDDISELKTKIQTAKADLLKAFNEAQNLDPETLEPKGRPTELTEEAALASYNELSQEIEQLLSNANDAQDKYIEDLAELKDNVESMKAAYKEVVIPTSTTKADEIQALKLEIEGETAKIDANFQDEEGNELRPAPSKLESIQGDIDATNDKIEKLAEMCKESEYTPGHISDQPGAVDGSDIATMVKLILKKETIDKDANPNKFAAADMDGDGQFTVADLIQINNIYLYGNKSGQVAEARSAAYNTSTVAMDIQGSEMNVSINGNKPYSAIQMDITVPEGVVISGYSYTGNSKTVLSGVNVLENGAIRVLFYAMDGTEINMSSALAGLELAGEGTGFVEINNILAAGLEGGLDQLESISTSSSIATGIDAVAAFDTENSTVYSVDGTKSSTLKKGINIIKNAAGKVMKAIRK